MLRTMFFVFKKPLLPILKYFVLFLKPGVGLVSGLPLLENDSDSFSGIISNWKRDVSGRVISLVFELDGLKINS